MPLMFAVEAQNLAKTCTNKCLLEHKFKKNVLPPEV